MPGLRAEHRAVEPFRLGEPILPGAARPPARSRRQCRSRSPIEPWRDPADQISSSSSVRRGTTVVGCAASCASISTRECAGGAVDQAGVVGSPARRRGTVGGARRVGEFAPRLALLLGGLRPDDRLPGRQRMDVA